MRLSNIKMNKTEEHYIAKALKGDTMAFEWLVIQYKDLVYTLALRMLQIPEEAEELAQDVFMQVYKSLNQFKKKSKFSTWLYRITYNLSVNKLKSISKSYNNKNIEEVQQANAAKENDSLYKLQEKEQQQIIQSAINKLQELDRFIISLYYFDDLSLKEIAEVVGIKAGNVKIKLHRSREFLHEQLKNKVSTEMIHFYE